MCWDAVSLVTGQVKKELLPPKLDPAATRRRRTWKTVRVRVRRTWRYYWTDIYYRPANWTARREAEQRRAQRDNSTG